MFDPHKTPSYFFPPSPIERRKSGRRISGSDRSGGGSVSSAEEVRVIDPAVTVIPTPPASPSFLFRNAVLLHVSPDSVAESAGLYDDHGGVGSRQDVNLG